MYAKSALKAMLGEAVPGSLDPELVPVDRIMLRWAVANGSGLPANRWDDNPRQSKPPPLDDDTALVVDRLVLKCPEKTRIILQKWYCTPEPVHIIAERLKMSRRALYTGWGLSLNFIRWRMEQTNHRTLLPPLHARL